MDQIRIRGLRIYARHGVFEEERKLGQSFIVDAVLNTRLQEAGDKDDLNLSTDYGAVCEKITQDVYKRQLLRRAFRAVNEISRHQPRMPHLIKL